jgi:hypothetical protein
MIILYAILSAKCYRCYKCTFPALNQVGAKDDNNAGKDNMRNSVFDLVKIYDDTKEEKQNSYCNEQIVPIGYSESEYAYWPIKWAIKLDNIFADKSNQDI